MPLAMGPHAVLCAPSRAACSVCPAAAAQLVRPRNSMHTRHCTLARAVVMKRNSAATARRAAMLYSVERFMATKVGTAPNLSTTRAGRHRAAGSSCSSRHRASVPGDLLPALGRGLVELLLLRRALHCRHRRLPAGRNLGDLVEVSHAHELLVPHRGVTVLLRGELAIL